MAITLIHGNHRTQSKQALDQLILTYKNQNITESITLNGKKCSITDIAQNLQSDSMFSASRVVIIEQLFKRPSKNELKQIAQHINQTAEMGQNHLVIYETETLPATKLKLFPTADVRLYKLPATIFKLTDTITRPTKLSHSLELLNTTCQNEAPELVLIMLARHLKTMIQTLNPEAKLTPYQHRLKTPAQTMGFDRLKYLHHQLHLIDYRNKTGQAPGSLETELAQWLATVYSKGD